MKRVRNLETLTPKWTVPIKSFPPGIRETFKKRRQIDIARGNQENQTLQPDQSSYELTETGPAWSAPFQAFAHVMASSVVFLWNPWVCISGSLLLVSSIEWFPSFCLSCPTSTWYFLFYILHHYYIILLEACLFSNERRKGRGSGKELGGKEGGEMNVSIYYVRKIYLQ